MNTIIRPYVMNYKFEVTLFVSQLCNAIDVGQTDVTTAEGIYDDKPNVACV